MTTLKHNAKRLSQFGLPADPPSPSLPSNPDLHLFYGGPFSNWYPARFRVPYSSELKPNQHMAQWFESSEHYYMWLKARHFNDAVSAAHIMRQGAYPAVCKRLGKQVKGYDEAAWAKVRFIYMLTALRLKFGQNAALARQLIATDQKEIAEASPTDRVWGIGLAETDPKAYDTAQWRGENLLGKALMLVRQELQAP